MAKILHIITDLDVGGAETMLWRLLDALDRDSCECSVLSLLKPGPIGGRIAELGVPVQTAAMQRGLPTPGALRRVSGAIKALRPDLIHTWMYHADLAGSLAAKDKGIPVVWGIHHTGLDAARNPLRTRMLAKWLARMSYRVPARIVCCAEATRQAHIEAGYDPSKMTVIPNGVDTDAIRPDAAARAEIRTELRLDEETPLVGLVARDHPDKNIPGWIEAARLTHKRRPNTHYLLCGRGLDNNNEGLVNLIQNAGLGDVCHLMGLRGDAPRILAALDLFGLGSLSEAFPLALIEAMAAGTPIVTTDVGDARLIAGKTGVVTPCGDPVKMAEAWTALLGVNRAERVKLGLNGRARIVNYYSLELTAQRYGGLYGDLAGPPKGKNRTGSSHPVFD